jgi:isopenicillin-N N-acyltransferase-like protein
MNRRELLKMLPIALLTGCGLSRIDPWHVLIRSDKIRTLEDEAAIVARGRAGWTDDGRIRVVYLEGNAYERGYQHGVLLRREVEDNLGYLYDRAVDKFYFEEIFDEVYERLRPYIPQDYIDEMHGLAHGARMPLRTIHNIHALPEMGEWGGKKRVHKIIKRMMAGEDFGTSCSNIGASPAMTADGEMYTVRVLDWGLHKISKLHQYPLIAVHKPDNGIPYANIGWVGFLGAISGMNAQKITLGEMGYGDPPNERLEGIPMPFLLREVLLNANSLADVRRIIGESRGTNSFAYLMTDGKNGDSELYVKDMDRFLVFKPGERMADRDKEFPGVPGAVYGGHKGEEIADVLEGYRGRITPEYLMTDVIPKIALKSNFQNVIYKPRQLQFWVNNARSKSERAAEQPYTFFDLGKAIASFRGPNRG